jgi:hypothetical protein
VVPLNGTEERMNLNGAVDAEPTADWWHPCDRISGTQIYKIISAYPLSGADLDQWRENIS